MDPAAFSPPRELQEAVVNSASKLINQWLEHEGEAPLYAVEANLQHLISGYPWLLDSLHPLVQNFVLHELHLHPPASTACLLASTEDVLSEPPDEGLPGPSEPSPKKKRRSRHRRGTPQPAVRTYKQPAVVSERDTVSALSDTRAIYSGAIFCISTLDTSVFSVSSMAKASKTVFLEPMSCVNDCVHSAAAKPGITEPGIMNSENENIWDSFSSALVFSGEAVNLTETVLPDHVLTSTLSPQFNVGSAIQLAFQSAGQLPSVQSAGQLPSVLLASPPPITPSLQSSPLPVGQSVAAPLPIAQLPLVHLSAHSPIQPPSSLSHSKQRTHFTTTSAGSLKLATSETVTPSRASPEAGCHSPANSGPLEAKTPAPAAPPENSPEQSRLSAPPESSSEFTHLPPSSECIGEHFQPSEDCIPLLLPECSHCAAQSQRVSTLTEVCVPAASVSVSAGGPEEPTQHHTSLAEGPGGPRQHVLPSAGGPGRSVQPSPAESSPATSTSPPASSPATSSPAASISPPAAVPLLSGSASVSSSTPGPASAPPSAPPSPGPASAPPSPGPGPAPPLPGPASPGPAVATPSWDPARPVLPSLLPCARSASRPVFPVATVAMCTVGPLTCFGSCV
ncbi:unnamed protein product, partial [Oreochromis niloticus]